MVKKLFSILAVVLLGINCWGCMPILIGSVGAGDRAFWFSDKISQEFNQPFELAIGSVKRGLTALNLPITKEAKTSDSAQIISRYPSQETVIVEVTFVSDLKSRVDVRVGILKNNPDAAETILRSILKNI
ncbi:MAG: DUF3568 family protein [Candidatus Omnitrophica bacterium]|nr:DUF3568 family protein [Candidatus Omnitrophota bacterium]